MSDTQPRQWLLEQLRFGHAVHVVLDSDDEQPMLQALIKNSRPDQYLSVYSKTLITDLSEVGPFVFTFDNPNDRNLQELLSRPDSHWGWLASLPKGHLPQFIEHWRERLIVGERPHQAVYRFHDNRVLARALAYLPVEAHAAYLGPANSVCYWQGDRWEHIDNPSPGIYPVPEVRLWLQVPMNTTASCAISCPWSSVVRSARRSSGHQAATPLRNTPPASWPCSRDVACRTGRSSPPSSFRPVTTS